MEEDPILMGADLKLVSADAVQACADEAQAVDKLVYADAVQASGPPPCKLFLE